MRYPTIHGFLKWIPTAIGGAALGVAAIWSEAKDWISAQVVWGWHQMSDPLIAVTLIGFLCAYIWAIIWTGQTPKAKPVKARPGVVLIGKGLDHVRVQAGSAVRGLYEARFFPTGKPKDPLSPDVAAIVEGKQRNLTKIVAAKLSASEKWMPLDQAILYLANGSQWGFVQDQDDPHFSVKLSIQLQDALACGDLTARGRKFHILKGGIKDPPLYPLTPLGKGFWQQARVDAYWPLAGTAQNIASHGVENVVRKGDHEGMHDVLVNQHQLEALWPPRQSAFDAPRIPFASLRDLATEYGLNLDHRDPAASNLAYDIEGELKEAAANNRLPVWGRPYNGPVRDHDPLVPIPADHFLKYSFRHGALEHVMQNKDTCTTTIPMVVEREPELEGVTFYDLHVSTLASRAIIKRIADERVER